MPSDSLFNPGRRVTFLTPLVVAAFVCGFATSVLAQEQASGDAAPKKGPKYFGLRFNEDWSYLEGPADSYEPDFFDPIKNIGLGHDWRVSFGGEVRARIMSETNNRGFGAIEPAQDTYLLHRVFLHADVKYGTQFRFFVQGINAMVEDRDFAALGIDENRFDFQQVFADMRVLGEDVPLTLRVGRQDLLSHVQCRRG
ncbi:MAG: alginate export family protein [Planctomycetes bacterium]|nr:alginate export family protein [Planctomycetota bacterium]